MSIQTNIAAGYLASFEAPIGVSIMAKLTQWPFLQQLNFNSTLSYQNQTFHGLQDFNTQMSEYSATSALLTAAWKVIKSIVPKNPKVTALMFNSPVLGQVGNIFQQLDNFGNVFSVPPSQLQNPAAISASVKSATSSNISLPSSTVGV